MRQWLANERGFTLAELLTSTAVIAVVMAGVLVLQQGGQQSYLLGSSRVETQQNARLAVDMMSRELRTATSLTTIATTPDITFVDQSGNTIRYCWSSSTTACNGAGQLLYLIRTLNGAADTLIGGVQAMTISYYDKATVLYTGTDQTQVSVVKISVMTKTEDNAGMGSAGDQHAVMESTIKLRATLS